MLPMFDPTENQTHDLHVFFFFHNTSPPSSTLPIRKTNCAPFVCSPGVHTCTWRSVLYNIKHTGRLYHGVKIIHRCRLYHAGEFIKQSTYTMTYSWVHLDCVDYICTLSGLNMPQLMEPNAQEWLSLASIISAWTMTLKQCGFFNVHPMLLH